MNPRRLGVFSLSAAPLRLPPTQRAPKFGVTHSRYPGLNPYLLGLTITFLNLLDSETREHSLRVAQLASELVCHLSDDARVPELLYVSGLAHDVGKLFVKRSVLLKPDALSGQDIQVLRQHPRLGSELLARYGFPDEIIGVARYHHERFDGQGYPYGLSGYQIPLAARVLAVADAFDAMTSARCYRSGISAERAAREIVRCAGQDFDPRVVSALTTVAARRGQAAPQWLNLSLKNFSTTRSMKGPSWSRSSRFSTPANSRKAVREASSQTPLALTE
jgi:putative nucleotidyltransferase with HDIG domain